MAIASKLYANAYNLPLRVIVPEERCANVRYVR